MGEPCQRNSGCRFNRNCLIAVTSLWGVAHSDRGRCRGFRHASGLHRFFEVVVAKEATEMTKSELRELVKRQIMLADSLHNLRMQERSGWELERLVDHEVKIVETERELENVEFQLSGFKSGTEPYEPKMTVAGGIITHIDA